MELSLDFPGLSLGLALLHWNDNGVWELCYLRCYLGTGVRTVVNAYVSLAWFMLDGSFRAGQLSLCLGLNGYRAEFP